MAVICLASAVFCTTTCFASETSSKKATAKSEFLQVRRYNVGINVSEFLYPNCSGPVIDIKPNAIIKAKKDECGENLYYTAKKGTYIANAKEDGKVVGKVKFIVGDFKTKINAKNSNINLIYNKNVEFSLQEINGYYSTSQIRYLLSFPKKGAKYSIKTTGKSILKQRNNELVSTGVGKSTYTLYQKMGNNKATKVGNFTVNIKAKNMSMAEATKLSLADRTDGIFSNDDIYLLRNEKRNTKKDFTELLSIGYGIYIKPSNYKITYSVKDTKIATVSKSGVVKAKKKGITKYTAKISFTDKSTYTYKCDIYVES